MFIQGTNDTAEEVERISDFIAKIKPKKSYLAAPTRPPAEEWVRPPSEFMLNMAFQVFRGKSIPAEFLIGYEGNAFAFTGNVEQDLLGITAVHPMREEAVREFLEKADSGWDIIENLIDENKLVEVKYEDKVFYVRKLANMNKAKKQVF
jgi:wyosine [tRNA(Phe)-imidazoG37] synthetase (radical SAM superfamily)